MTASEIWNNASGFLLQCFSLSILVGLIPAFLIAGGINVFVSPALVLKYLGAGTNKIVSYSVATVAGVILSTCSCTAIPLFAGLRKRGVSLGPAFAFLVSAPGISILPLVYTFQLFGASFGWAYLVGAMALSIAIGLSMALIFYRDEPKPIANLKMALPDAKPVKKGWILTLFFVLLVVVLFLLGDRDWFASAIVWAIFVVFFIIFFSDDEFSEWMGATYQFVRIILPWLLLGIVGATLIVALVPTAWITNIAGGDSLSSCFVAALFGAFNYLCPPSQVFLTRGFVDLGMGQGPALSFIIMGPAVSLPSVVILGKIVGWKKAFTYIGLLLIMSTIMGYVYGIVR